MSPHGEGGRHLAAGADALVLVTEWEEFRHLNLAELAPLMATPILVDGRNVFHPEQAVEAGFDYTGIGRRVLPKVMAEAAAAITTAS